jgi:hypothetical protein
MDSSHLVRCAELLLDTTHKPAQASSSPYQLSELKAHKATPFIYSYIEQTAQLWRTHLFTGEDSCHSVSSYLFKVGCCWSDLSDGSLLITGGGEPDSAEVVRIDTLREFVVSQQPPMITPRSGHTCVYYAQGLYVLSGVLNRNSDRYLKECERYVQSRWEALPPLPVAGCSMCGVVVDGSLYALGGYDLQHLDLIQKLRLDELTWELLELKLPLRACSIPCFKLNDTEVYLVINSTLCSFTPQRVQHLKTLPSEMHAWFGPSSYSRGLSTAQVIKDQLRD